METGVLDITLCDIFVSDMRKVGFPRVLRFPPPIKFVHHVIAEILLKVALNTIILFQSNPKQQQQNTNDRATYGSVHLDFHYEILLDI